MFWFLYWGLVACVVIVVIVVIEGEVGKNMDGEMGRGAFYPWSGAVFAG